MTEKVLTGVCAKKQLLGQGVADRPKTHILLFFSEKFFCFCLRIIHN
jgi:hypothetical protein